ncbi:hypothetical protein [Nonomuraea rubra]|uniref:hypothetical protein n=1 Tax=Nonomuraea rubra TaxID=46180 RepID=UPI0031ED9205
MTHLPRRLVIVVRPTGHLRAIPGEARNLAEARADPRVRRRTAADLAHAPALRRRALPLKPLRTGCCRTARGSPWNGRTGRRLPGAPTGATEARAHRRLVELLAEPYATVCCPCTCAAHAASSWTRSPPPARPGFAPGVRTVRQGGRLPT